jgi:hypothetical protein
VNENDDRLYRRAKARVEELKGFYVHLMVYVVVNAGLVAINLLTTPGSYWFYWPLIGWGIGLIIHGLMVFGGGLFGSAWEERKVRELMDEERRKQARGPA